jgi:parallel beta-helix repeat protein
MFARKSRLILATAVIGLALLHGEFAAGRDRALFPPPGPCVGSGTCTIDCSTQTITEALANGAAGAGGRLTIIVNGNCTEDITIERDRVTLKDGTLTGTGADQPVIQILSARGIVIDNMTVQGPASPPAVKDGILDTGNADVTITNNSIVQNHGRNGIVAKNSASVTVTNSTVQGNGRNGIDLRNSSAIINGNQIINNIRHGIAMVSSSGHIFDNTITTNGRDGITVDMTGSVMVGPDYGFTEVEQPGNTITNNARMGVKVVTNSSGRLSDNTITGHPGDPGTFGAQPDVRISESVGIFDGPANTIGTCDTTTGTVIGGTCP